MTRQYNLSMGQLLDRLSIVNLKSIKIPEGKTDFEKEAKEIMHDLDVMAKELGFDVKEFGQLVRAIQINAVVNEVMWANESFVRKGEDSMSKEDIADKLLFTHSLNRVRNQAMNLISVLIGERKDLKTDYLDAEVTKRQGYDFGGNVE